MNPTKSLTRQWYTCVALALTWLGATLAHAQPAGNGTIQGRVFNPVAKEYIRDAEVRLEGTGQVTYTENDGSFRFINVPAGTAKVTVNFTGYTSVTEEFTVTAGQVAAREINLLSAAAPGTAAGAGKDGVIQLGAFTVSSEREGNSKAIMAQRRNMNIATSVSSDIFGEVTDGNVGEFLKYLPGVDLDYVESEPRGPRLGGMDGQYVGVAFDGMRTANADANRGGGAASRATSFEGFSITSIDSIEVNWTASPENDADTPAGNVNMKTKRAFDRKGRRIGYNFSLNFNGEDFTWKKTDGPADYKEEKWKPNYQFDYSESFFNQRFGVLLSLSQVNSYTEQQISTTNYQATPLPHDPRPMVVRQIDMKDGPKWIRKDAALLTMDWKASERLTLSLNGVYSYYDGEFWNRNFTWTAANDNANVNVANGRSSVGGNGVTEVIATRVASGSTPTSQTNTVANLSNGGGTSAKLQYTRQIAPRFEYKVGSLVVDGAFAISYAKNNYESIERGFSNNEGGSVASSFIATRRDQSSAEWVIRQTSGDDWFNLGSFYNNPVPVDAAARRAGGTRITNDDRTWITEKWTGTLNARYALPFMERFPTSVKFGGKWDEETRHNRTDSDVNIWSYVGPGGNTVAFNQTLGAWENTSLGSWANVGPQFVSSNPFELGRTNALNVYNINGTFGMPPRVSRNEIATLFRSHPEQWVYTGTPENFYNAKINQDRYLQQAVSAGYGQADVRLTPKLQFRTGIRMEETRTKTREYVPLTRAEVAAAGYPVNAVGTAGGRALTVPGLIYQYMSQPRAIRKANYQNWFPSAVLKYQILPNFDWQAGWNKSIGRPAIDDLTGVWSIDENAQRVTLSNPALMPEYHKKFQTRLGYYFSGRSPGQLTLSLSQVASRNFVQTFDLSAAQMGIDDPEFQTYTFRTRINSPTSVKYRNMDFAYNQTLGFLPSEYLRGISVGFNYSRSYADQRRQNLAPHRVSGRLGYAYRRFSTNLGIIWADDKPESGTYGRYFGQITKIDLGLTFRVTRYASLFVQGRNITNMVDRWYQSPTGATEGDNPYMRQIESYGSNWNFGVRGQF